MESQEPVVYIKTIREIADEIGVSKQAVFKKISRQPLSTELIGLTSTVDGRLMVSVDGERLIKQAFCAENTDFDRQPSTKTVNHQPSTINQVDGKNDDLEVENEKEENQKKVSEVAQSEDSGAKSEVAFLRRQMEQMNDQLLRRDTMIESLSRELEKEREHNREKDRQLLDTLTKLAETQAALAVGQSAEKQKALAETLIEGQQIIDGEHGESIDKAADVYADFDDEFREEPKKRGVLQRVWDAITGKG